MKIKHGLFIGIAVLIAAAVFTFTGCPTDTDENNSIVGVWKQDDATIEFTADVVKFEGGEYPYTLSGTALTVTIAGVETTATATVKGSTLTLSGFGEDGPNGIWTRQ
jgi:hypothetical protein